MTPGSRRIAQFAALATIAAGLAVPGLVASAPGGPDTGVANVTEQPDKARAVTAARLAGRPVEIANERTATGQTFALPEGGFRREESLTPRRAKRPDGTWAPVDTTLVRGVNGAIRPVNAPLDLAFSGGGSQVPLLSLADGAGRRVTMTWPGVLPAPRLTGNVATYAEVLPGVDLQLRAEADGPRKVLVVKSREAAANPALAELRLGLRTDGVTAAVGSANNLLATDATGRLAFVTSTVEMWDATPDEAGRPGPEWAATDRGRRANVGIRLDGDSVVMTPDQALLTDPATVYPVRIDPVWHAVGHAFWLQIRSDNPNATHWNGSDSGDPAGDVRVGRTLNGSSQYSARAFVFFDSSFMNGKRILNAYLQLTMAHSWTFSCSEADFPFDVHAVSGLNGNTTWNNQNNWGGIIGTTTITRGNPGGQCPADTDISFDVTARARDFAANSWSQIDFGLRSRNESCVTRSGDLHCPGWRRFKDEGAAVDGGLPIRFSVTYNDVPGVPTDLQFAGQACNGNTLLLGAATNYAVTATLSDPNAENVNGTLQLLQGSTVVHTQTTGYVPNGTRVTWTVPASAVPTGAYTVRAAATDNEPVQSGWTAGCTVTVDQTAPPGPGISSTDYPAGTVQYGSVGKTGQFTLNTSASDVVKYRYGLTTPPTTEVTPATAGGSVTLPITPDRDGAVTLYARAVDQAGNVGPITPYVFNVKPPVGPVGHWKLDEGNGTNAADTPYPDNTADLARPATISGGPAWVTDPIDARLNHEKYLRYNRSGQTATAQPVLDTTNAFTVTAWVRLTGTPTGNRTAVAQDGNRASGFYLQYFQPNGRWRFTMLNADQDNPTGRVAESSTAAALGVWTHLAGVYDPMARKVYLYVNGTLAGTADMPERWSAGGAFTIGRAKWNGGNTDTWEGDIADVRAYNRALRPTEFIGFVKPVQAWYGFHDGQSTSVTDRSGNGRTGTLVDGASVGTGFSGTGVALNGDKAQVTTAGPAVHTNQNFTVSGWVRLNHGDEWRTVVSQDGTRNSAFALRYNPYIHRWQFTTTGADADGSPEVSAASTTVPRYGEWTHLAGVYNATSQQVQLWVNGVLEATAAGTIPWDATGRLAIGRGQAYAFQSGWWEGDLDEVLVHAGALSAEEIRVLAKTDDRIPSPQHLAGDFTGDGKADTVIIHGYPNKVMKLWALANSGGGDLATPVEVWNSEFAPWEMPTGWQHDGARWNAGDFNGDGKDDIAITLRDDHFDATWQQWAQFSETWIFYSNGAGFDEPMLAWDVIWDSGWGLDNLKIEAGDVSGDGKDDLVILRSQGSSEYGVWVLHGWTTGLFAPIEWFHSAAGQADPRRVTLKVGDVDNDGKADLVQAYHHDGNQVKLSVNYSTGTAFTTWSQQWDSGANAYSMARAKMVVTDVTGDGKADVVHYYDNGTNRQVRMFKSNGRAAFTAPVAWLDTATCTGCVDAIGAWPSLTLAGADLDGDGPDDLIGLRTTPDSKVVRVYTIRSTGGTFEPPVLRYTSGPDGI